MGMMIQQLARTRLRNYPENLFRGGAVGAWFDPSDFSTMFQDAAGTTPVTALGQPVGKILDKSPLGKHATCPGATTSRPTIEARVNRLQASENLSDGYWAKSGCSISNDTVSTYDKIVESSGGTYHNIAASPVVIGASQRLSFSAVPAGRNWVWCQVGLAVAYFDLANGVLGTVSGSLSASIAPDPEGGYRCTVTHSNPTTTTLAIGAASGDSSSSYSGDGSSGISVGKIQLAFNDDPFKAVYQRVNTATDYTDIGAPRYLAFDGTDDWLETATIDMTSTDSVVAVAGVRKNSDTTLGIIYELSANANSNNGSFYLVGPGANGAASYGYVSKGTLTSGSSAGSLAAPISNVTTLVAKISTDTSILRVNGAQAASAAGDQGTGNYGNHKLYIGRRGGLSLPFNGRLYGLVIVGAAQSDAIVSALEKHMAMKTGVSF